MDALRIAVLLPHLGVYGGVRRFLELGNAWVRRGHDVAILLPDSASPREPWIRFTGRVGPIRDLDAGGWDAALSPDPALFAAHRGAGALRVFYAVLEGAPGEDRALRQADLVLANSLGMRRRLARRGVAAVDAAGGVDVARFRPPEPDRRAGWPGDRVVEALVYGRISRRRKGTWAAARAVERAARRTDVPVRLTLFDAPGPGAPPPALPGPLAIPHRWILNPTQEDLASLYGSADLFVSAERRAGWSNTAAEAMACGAAVVCTRSGTEDFAVDGTTARVCRWPWSWLLGEAVASLLLDPAARTALASAGRARIAEFSWERTADRIERALRVRLEGGSPDREEAALTR